MEIANTTNFSILSFPQIDKKREERTVVLATALFNISPNRVCVLSEKVADIQLIDCYYENAKESSLRIASEIAYDKPSTDIYFIDPVAVAPNGRMARQWSVEVSVGQMEHSFDVCGSRKWNRGILGEWNLGDATECTEIPIRFESAFGGSEDNSVHRENPVGTGLFSKKCIKDSKALPAPQIFFPSDPPTIPNRIIEVAGLTPIAPSWYPRKHYAGTYDDTWLKNDWPNWPEDFDASFFNFAPQGLQHVEAFADFTPVTISGMSKTPLNFRLPRLNSTSIVVFCDNGTKFEIELKPRTLAFDIGKMELQVCWGTGLRLRSAPYYSQLQYEVQSAAVQ